MKRDKTENFTVGAALKTTESALFKAGITEAAVEAQWILVEVLGVKRFELFLRPKTALSVHNQERLNEILRRRAQREPLAYIIGHTDFRGHRIRVTRHTLIPRPETELLVDEALSILRTGDDSTMNVLDVCTGSGCISVALGAESKRLSITALDISEKALAVAHHNAVGNNVADKIHFIRGDLFYPIKNKNNFDLIVSNPPYIPENDMRGLQAEVRLYEPALALDGGPGGMDYIKRLIEDSPKLLRPGGSLLLEIGTAQAEKACKLALERGDFEAIHTKKDLSGIERIFLARKKTPR